MQGSGKGLETGFERSFSQGRDAGFAASTQAIWGAVTAVEFKFMVDIQTRQCWPDIRVTKLAIKVPLRVSRVGVKPLARRIEYLAHSPSVFLASLLRISSSILGVM